MKYEYFVGKNKVVCVARYAGKSFRGVAKCDSSHDEFNVETGMKLAKLRCDAKIAEKRKTIAEERFCLATITLIEAKSNEEHRRACFNEAATNLEAITNELKEFENKLINS